VEIPFEAENKDILIFRFERNFHWKVCPVICLMLRFPLPLPWREARL
jgi:hypothetical protein